MIEGDFGLVKSPNEYHPVARVVEILECISEGRGRFSVRTIANELGISKTSVHRILDTLESRRWVEKDPNTEHYTLGVKILQLVGGHFRFSDLRDKAIPVMRDLQAKCEETVSFYVREDAERVCIERIEGSHEIRSAVRVGQRLPLHAGAAGKVLIAPLPINELVDLLDERELTKITEHTVVDKEVLVQQFVGIVQQGYATSFEERVPWAASVAAPVHDSRGRVAGAINITGPKPRFEGKNLTRYIDQVKKAAAEISRMNGYVPRKGGDSEMTSAL